MKGIFTIFKREINAYFDSPIAYVFAAIFLLLTCGIYMNDFFLISTIQMESYFYPLSYLMIFFLPALSMRLWAEEKRDNTYELLMTLPLKNIEIILGKYFAVFSYFLITLIVGTLPIIIMLNILGSPDGGQIFSSYLGVFFLGGFYLAVGVCVSGFTHNQIVAYLFTIFILALFYVFGLEQVASILDGLWVNLSVGSFLRDSFSVVPHYESFIRGVVDLRDVLYFIFLIILSLVGNDLALKRGR